MSATDGRLRLRDMATACDRARARASRPSGQTPPVSAIAERVSDQVIIGDSPYPVVGCRPRGRFSELAGQRGSV